MNPAPIALFVYNRPEHTRRTVLALQKNELAPESDLIVFCDGAKNNDLDQQAVRATRNYIRTIAGFKSLKIVECPENNGLAKSIITGVTEVVNNYGRVIVVEDDLITSRYFLRYMNEGLKLYENDDKVISIHGYIYPVKRKLPETFFLKGADCWGWATWKRGWDLFEADGQKLLDELETKKLAREFDFNNSYPYTQMLRDQIKGRNNSWAIRWYASAFLKNKLTLYPGRSLVSNIGFDNTGTHCRSGNQIDCAADVGSVMIELQKITLIESSVAKKAIIKYFRRENGVVNKIIKITKRLLGYAKKNSQKI
jgi:hypothetical protein